MSACARAFGGYIEDNRLEAGDPLPPEVDLAQQLGVGRNSVREAIKALESLGVLETRRGVGVFVKAFSFQPLLENLAYGLQISLRDVEEMREIRRVLETGLIDKTVAMIGEDDIAALARGDRAHARQAPSAGESFAEEDQHFHQLLFRCQDNHTLSALIDVFWTAFYKASDFANLDNPDAARDLAGPPRHRRGGRGAGRRPRRDSASTPTTAASRRCSR